MEKLKIDVWNKQNVVLLRVLQMDDRIRGIGTVFEPFSTNIVLESCDYVYIGTGWDDGDIDNITVGLRGTKRGYDNHIACYQCHSTSEAKQIVKNIKKAVNEYNFTMECIGNKE